MTHIYDNALPDVRGVLPAVAWLGVGLFLLLAPVQDAAAQEIAVSGTVTDAASGTTIPGVNVRVVGTQTGTATNAQGRYELTAPSPDDSLRFSFVGYEPQTIGIDGRSTINVALETTTLTGGEVIVTGYSTQQRKDLTGSVEVVNTADMQKMPEAQITDQLQGMASGVNVLSSGQPGQDPQIRIRGINTFGNNTPLFVVDGVTTQSINDLNPNDIESIQVLKDASAASIYGARASNGVVIVETKKGSGDVSVQVNSYAGISQQPDSDNPWDMLDPQGRAELEWMAFRNSGQTPSDPQYGEGDEPRLPDFILPTGAMEGDPGTDPSEYFVDPFFTDGSQLQEFTQIVRANKQGTDWFDEIMETAPMSKTDLTVSGGGQNGSYLFSAGYLNQQGTLRRTFLERYSVRANTSYNVTENIRIGENLSYTLEENRLGGTLVEGSSIGMAMRARPIVPVRDIMGNWAGSAGGGLGNPQNPVAIRERTRNNASLDKRLFGNAFVEVSFLEDFLFKTSFGGSVNSGFFETFQFPTFENSENNATNALDEQAWNNHDWTLTNTLNFNRTFAQSHNVTALAGVEWQKTNTRFEFARVEDFFSFDPNFVNLANGAGAKTINSQTRVTSLASQFGKIDYNYKGRYFLSGTLRRDGSSKFLNDRYGTFPAVSGGWRISEESFMEGVLPWLTDLKFRAGWGVMGNQLNVTPNNAFTLFGSRNFAYDITGSNANTGLGFVPSQIGAPNAKWEKDRNLNIGVDLAVLDGRLEATVDWYKKDIEDLLFNPELPAPAGQASAPFINVASMENTGVDASVRGETEVRGIQVEGSVNLTTYSNEITSLAEGFDSFSEEDRRFNATNIVRNEVGQEMSSYFGYQIVGFWQSEDEIQQANNQAPDGTFQTAAAPGRFRYEDVNGDGQITSDDRTFLGSPNPDFTYGINLNLGYDNWDLSVALFGSQGAEVWNQVKWWTDFFSGFNGAKAEVALNDSWTPDNRDASAPIQETERTFSTNQVPNSYFVEDASYLRIQNLQIGYTLPDRWVQRLGAESLRIYAQASNLYTFTGYSNPEPEIGGSDPTDVTSFGIDEGSFPTPRQFLGGVNLTF
jgi:TonB-linked SusC/RagA family outer membrane protein